MKQRVTLYFGQRYQKTKPTIDENIMTEILFKKEYFSVKVRKHIIVGKRTIYVKYFIKELIRFPNLFHLANNCENSVSDQRRSEDWLLKNWWIK